MILSRAWLHDTVPCAAWNDARTGVYLQKRTPAGPQCTMFLKMQCFDVPKNRIWKRNMFALQLSHWVSKKEIKLIDYKERLGKSKASECIERKWLLLGSIIYIYNIYIYVYIYIHVYVIYIYIYICFLRPCLDPDPPSPRAPSSLDPAPTVFALSLFILKGASSVKDINLTIFETHYP